MPELSVPGNTYYFMLGTLHVLSIIYSRSNKFMEEVVRMHTVKEVL